MKSELDRLCQKHRIKASSQYAEAPEPIQDQWMPGTSHYKVTLRGWGRQLTVDFHMGPAHCSEPTAADVLACVYSDAMSAENARNFEEFAAEFGYDSDSRKAEGIYKACQAMTPKVKRFLGEHFEEFCRAEH